MTGEILRAQREPEKANSDFDCWIERANGASEDSTHRLSIVTPMPEINQYRPEKAWIPADTWVELTFADETGSKLPPIRRTQTRTNQGRLEETPPDYSVLGVDPIALRIGTVMPGLLPLIKVGSESELGRAVAQLTGLSALIDLANHAKKTKARIDGDFTKARKADVVRIDSAYSSAADDLQELLRPTPSLATLLEVPPASEAEDIEGILSGTRARFEDKKVSAYAVIQEVLGTNFDPSDQARSKELEHSIGPAISELSQPQRLPSIARLRALRELTDSDLEIVSVAIEKLLSESSTLIDLARDPSASARARLYARVASWIQEHPDAAIDEDICVVCGGLLTGATDPVSKLPVKKHLSEAKSNSELLEQTLAKWSVAALGTLSQILPEALQYEIKKELPDHPIDLMRSALLDELFSLDAFSGELNALRNETGALIDSIVGKYDRLNTDRPIVLPDTCKPLADALNNIGRAVAFARWRQQNDQLARSVFESVLGRRPRENEQPDRTTLTGKLLALEETIKGAEPIRMALKGCDRLVEHIAERRSVERRLTKYGTASAALSSLMLLGDLADQQVDELRIALRTEAALWRSRIYVGSFPSIAHELVDAHMGRKGELDLVVRAGGVMAPAQHVTNASALRASLVGFFLAFWEHVLKTRGGIRTILLDDPQELLDDENRQELAQAMGALVARDAQLIVTSYDRRFAGAVARLHVSPPVDHLAVHPATPNQPVIRTTPHQKEIQARKDAYDKDRNAEEPARAFADGCRVFLEAALGDVFDDPAHSTWAKENPHPTLAAFVSRLRALVKAGRGGMFDMAVFADFISQPALAENSLVLQLMNKAHHGDRQEIRPGDVNRCADDLMRLVTIAERMYEECARWKRRLADPGQPVVHETPAPLEAMSVPSLDIVVFPDLAAFTLGSTSGQSQETSEAFDSELLAGKSAYFLRRDNFGFAAPSGSLALVDAYGGTIQDRRLVVTRYRGSVFARRLVRAKGSDIVGLTAETPNPKNRSPATIFVSESEAAIHLVTGVLFDHDLVATQGSDEAVLVDATSVLTKVAAAFRVKDDSAIPLALPNQIVLGGGLIELNELSRHHDSLVAVTLDDGSSIFKRVGSSLPGDLAHLLQFESIGGLGSSQVLSVGRPQSGIPTVISARKIIGVLYRG